MISVKFLTFYENFLSLLHLSHEKRTRHTTLAKLHKTNNLENIQKKQFFNTALRTKIVYVMSLTKAFF